MDIHYPQLLSIVSAVVALTGFTLLAFRHSLRPHKASHEPPVIPQALPLIGHLVGIFRHGFEYFEHLA